MEPAVFEHQVMLVNLTDILAQIDDPPLPQFLAMLRETMKIFQQMGGALAMAFADIDAKIGIIRRCRLTMELEAKTPDTAGLYTLMREEMKLNVHLLNGENWVQLKDGREVFRNYESISRTMVRIHWFLSFVLYLLENLFNDRKRHSSSCCSDAYSRAFGDKHKFHIRVAAKAAMLMAPSRAKILEIFTGENNETKAYELIGKAKGDLEIVCSSISQFLSFNKLENLP